MDAFAPLVYRSRCVNELRVILLDILAPILLMVGIGALLRWKFAIDLTTLSKLNIYMFTPAFVFHHVSNSKLAWSDMGGIVVITVTQVITLGLLVFGIGKALRISTKTMAAIALAVMFYNSGNYGLPLAELAYPSNAAPSDPAGMVASATTNKDGGAVQAFVVMSQNVLTYTVGLFIAAWVGSGNLLKGLTTLIRLPVLPTLVAALTARWWITQDPENHHLPIFITKTMKYLADGLVPIALATLGAQLASRPRWPRWKPVSMVIVLRLIFGPIQMAALLFAFHSLGFKAMDLWPWPAELLILTASVPTAINTLLLVLEVGGDADLAADCVFWTTILSCLTITGWLIVIRMFFAG